MEHLKHHHHHGEEGQANQQPVVTESYAQYGGNPSANYGAEGYGGQFQQSGYGGGGDTANYYNDASQVEQERHGEKKHTHRAELEGLGAEAFARHEKHEEKKDPEHARRHKREEELATAAALGEGVHALHDHHENKKNEEEEHKKHHHLF